MLYALGDSFTYGFNFTVEQERVESVWPAHLAQLLSMPYQNLAVPGASNWRMARLITTLPITSDDIVVIGLSENKRFEFGVSPNHKHPIPKWMGDVNESDGNLITKRFFKTLSQRTTDKDAKAINDLTFSKFNNDRWYELMHIIMCSAIAYRLQSISCKWFMFDTHTLNPRLDIPNYILPKATMHDVVVPKTKFGKKVRYWTKEEHTQAAKILFDEFNGISNDAYEIYNANTNLDWFY